MELPERDGDGYKVDNGVDFEVHMGDGRGYLEYPTSSAPWLSGDLRTAGSVNRKEGIMGNALKIQVVVHVDDALNEDQRSDLVGHLQGCDGVEYACFTSGRDHLLLINYDRDRTQALDVLGYVRGIQTAELIGPI